MSRRKDREFFLDLFDPSSHHSISPELQEKLIDALKQLSRLESAVLDMRFGFGVKEHTRKQVAEHFKWSIQRVRWIENKALHKLKRILRARI
jgi:DNA-directed RNA polymerase sigma subunit (sigma70/sigma32)